MAFGTNSMKLGKDHVPTVCKTRAKITCEQCATRAQRSRANSVQDVRHVTYRLQRIVKKLKYFMASLLVGLLCFVFLLFFME